MEDELERLSADAALFVDRGLKQLQRLLLALAQEGGSPGQRQDHIDFIRIRGMRAKNPEQPCARQDGQTAFYRL